MDITSTPIPVRRALMRLGSDLQDARKRRRVPMKMAAERASISRATLTKIEKGDEGVSMGSYARVLFTMGMVDRLADLADVTKDKLGLLLQDEHLPKRIRLSRKKN